MAYRLWPLSAFDPVVLKFTNDCLCLQNARESNRQTHIYMISEYQNSNGGLSFSSSGKAVYSKHLY